MSAEISKFKGVQTLSTNTLSTVLTFLSPQDVARSERVCKVWQAVINSENQQVWKAQCNTQNIDAAGNTVEELPNAVLGRRRGGAEKFNGGILGCIVEYLGGIDEYVNYKEQAAVLPANIWFYTPTSYINDMAETNLCRDSFEWLNGAVETMEPFVSTRLSYGEYHQGMRKKLIPKNTPSCVQDFPLNVPLRFFINKDGSYKDTGDKVRVVFGKQRMILTCAHEQEFIDGRSYDTFKDALEERLRISCSVRCIQNSSIEKSKMLAAAAGEWTRIGIKQQKN